MGSFEVIEHEKDPKGEHGEFRIIAINFIDPEFVKIAAETDVDKGTLLDVEDDKVFLNRKQIGRVLEKKDGKSIRVSTSFDIKYTGGYSLDGNTVYLDEHFPQIMKIHGKEVDARESIGLWITILFERD